MNSLAESKSPRSLFSKESYLVNWLLKINQHIAEKNKQLILENNRLQSTIGRLKDVNFIDDTTGIRNKRYLQIRLREEYARACRHGFSLSAVFIDLDDFKSVNDRYGHVNGDRLLKEVASILDSLCRSEDAVVRFGGEEFVVLMSDTDGDKAVVLAERIRRAIRDQPLRCGDATVSLSASIGVSTFAVGDYAYVSDPESLIEMADRAMYMVKRNGKNNTFYLPFPSEEHIPFPSGVAVRHHQEMSL